MKNLSGILLLVMLSFSLNKGHSQQLFEVSSDVYRSTKDIPFAFQATANTTFIEYTNFSRQQVNVSIDTFLARTCGQFFKATFQDGKVVALNKDFVKRLEPRSGNRSFAYMSHTPVRYDLLESMVTLEGRLGLCESAGGSSPQTLYLQNDSLFITDGNGVPLDSMFAAAVYVGGVGIDVTGNVITNLGDTNPADDVLKTTNHDGDVTGVYNMLVIKDGVVTISKLDSANVLNWLVENFPLIDTTMIDTSAFLTWIYNHVDTTDLDEQVLSVTDSTLCISNGNCVALDSLSVGMIGGERGETMWFDGSEWVADSTIYNDGVQVGILTDTLFPGSLTVKGDTVLTLVGDTSWVRVVHKSPNVYMDWRMPESGWLIFKDSSQFTGPAFGYRSHLNMPAYRVSFPNSMVGISGSYTHTSGEKVELHIGQDSLAASSSSYAPTSGTGTYSGIKVSGTINQTGGTGISRGLHIQHLITSAYDYRAIDLGNSSGIGLYQSGALVTNRIRGKTAFGSLLSPARELHNYGQTRLQTPVPGADGLAGIHLANGDVSHVALGTGLTMSGDTLYATGDVASVTGEGEAGYLAKWTPDSITLGIGQVWDDSIGVGIGTTSPVRKLDVDGDLRVSESVDTAQAAYVWMSNEAGDFRKVAKGGDITIQGDSIAINGMPAGTVLNSTLRWDGSEWVENDSLLVNAVGNSAYGGESISAGTYDIKTRLDILVNGVRFGDRGVATNVLAGSGFVLTTGTGNTLMGFDAGNLITSGSDNTAMGRGALTSNVGGNLNTAIGRWAMGSHTLGSGNGYNSALGAYAMYSTSTGLRNTAIGGDALRSNTSGDENTALGYRAGYNSSSNGAISNNVFIGGQTAQNVTAGAAHNAVFGYGINLPSPAGSGQLVIANALFGTGTATTADSIGANAKIGVKVKTPQRDLHVAGDFRVTQDVDTATVDKLWAGSPEGDFRRVVLGEGLTLSNDTLLSQSVYEWVLDDGTDSKAVGDGDVLTVLGTGSVEATFDTSTMTLTINGLGPAGSGGETNLGLNVGPGEEIYKGKTDTTLLFRTLVDDGIATVTQVGDSVVIDVPAQTLSTSNDSIYISLGNGIKVPNVPPAGTVLNSTLRWNGSAWVENDSLLVNADGEAALGGTAINTSRSLVTSKALEVQGMYVGQRNDTTNTVIGRDALPSATAGFNTAVGYRAGNSVTLGYGTYVGHQAGRLITSASATAIGDRSMGWAGNKSGASNTAVGAMSMGNQTTAVDNTAVGKDALFNNTSSGSNTALGSGALRGISGLGNTYNVAVGRDALNQGVTLIGTTAIGAGAGYNSTSKHSVFVGRNAGYFVTKDSVMFIGVTSDTIGLVADLGYRRSLGVNRNPWGIARTLDVGGTARVRSSVDTATVSRLWGGNPEGDLRQVKLGTNLTVSNDTLNASGGVVWGDVGPQYLVGTNEDNDTLQKTVVTYTHPDELQQANVRLQNDTLMGLRGSYFQAYQNTTRIKTLAAGAIDTMRMSTIYTAFDWSSVHSNGRWELDFGPEDKVLPQEWLDLGATEKSYLHNVAVTATILSDGAGVNTKMYLYMDGAQQPQCQCEWTGNPERQNVSFDCYVRVHDGAQIDVRLHNDSVGSNQYIIYKLSIRATHDKTIIVIPF